MSPNPPILSIFISIRLWLCCILTVLLHYFASVPVYGDSPKSTQPTLGVILPLSGKAATAGEAVRNGIVLANESLPQPIHIKFEDNQLDGATTATIARKLISEAKVDGLIVYASGPSHVVAPLAENSEIPMIGMSVDPLVSRGKKWVMIHWASNQRVGEMLYAELERRKLTKVAVVTTQVQGLLDMEADFVPRADEHGVTITSTHQFLPTDTDFRTTIALLKNKSPEAIFLNLYYGQASTFAKQLAEQGFTPQLFSHFVLDNDDEIKNATGTLNGAFFASTGTGDRSFDSAYLQRFGKRAMVGAIAGYDILSLFAQSFQYGVSSREATRHYLHSVQNFSGKIGTYSALSDNTFDVPASVRVIQNGAVQEQ